MGSLFPCPMIRFALSVITMLTDLPAQTKAPQNEVFEALRSVSHRKLYGRGDCLYQESEAATTVYWLESGLVGLVKTSPEGVSNLLRVFAADNFLGHRSVFAGQKHHASARCLESCVVWEMERTKFLAALQRQPKLYAYFAKVLATELGLAENRSLMVAEYQLLARVAAAILYLLKLAPQHPWTRSEIAEFCASRTATVITALSQLEERGMISKQGRKIQIIDEAGLRKLVESF